MNRIPLSLTVLLPILLVTIKLTELLTSLLLVGLHLMLPFHGSALILLLLILEPKTFLALTLDLTPLPSLMLTDVSMIPL